MQVYVQKRVKNCSKIMSSRQKSMKKIQSIAKEFTRGFDKRAASVNAKSKWSTLNHSHTLNKKNCVNHDSNAVELASKSDANATRSDASDAKSVLPSTRFGGTPSAETNTLKWKKIGQLVLVRSSKHQAGHRMIGSSEMIDMELHKYLRHCIKYHQKILKCTRDFAALMRFILTEILLFIALGGVGILYVFSTVNGFDLKKLEIGLFLSISYFCLLLCCSFGEQITDESINIRHAIFSSDWMTASESIKLSLRIMMARTMKPVYFRAIGIPITLNMFRIITRGTYYTQLILNKQLHGEKFIEGH